MVLSQMRLLENVRGNHALGQRLSATGGFTWSPASDEFSCSEQLYRILGIESGSTVHFTSLLARIHPEDLGAFRGRLDAAGRSGDDITHEMRLLLPDQTVRHVRLALRASNSTGCEILGAIQDVTQLRRCEAALGEARADLAYAARAMSLGALSASIAHEIKQPLTGIITNAGTCLRMLAADPPDFAGARETARRTLRDGNRASDVITRLRALFTKRTVADETADLNQLAQEAVTLALSDLQHRRIIVGTELAEGLPMVHGDRIQLHQVILNLILNAADSMGGVEDRPRRLKICTRSEGADRVQLSVEDSGTGLAADESRLFEPFYTTKSDGMGIGLSISRAIVESHGGQLWATSNEDAGATFYFCIPREQHHNRTAGAVTPHPGDRTAPGRPFRESPHSLGLGL